MYKKTIAPNSLNFDAENGNVSGVSESALSRVRSIFASLVCAVLALFSLGTQSPTIAGKGPFEPTAEASENASVTDQPAPDTISPVTTPAPDNSQSLEGKGVPDSSFKAVQHRFSDVNHHSTL